MSMWTVLLIVWGALLTGWIARRVGAFIARAVRRRMLADDMSDVAAQAEGLRRWGRRYMCEMTETEYRVGVYDRQPGGELKLREFGRGSTRRAAFADADKNAKRAVDEVLK